MEKLLGRDEILEYITPSTSISSQAIDFAQSTSIGDCSHDG